MKKIIFAIFLCTCACVCGQTAVRDTIYQYETVIVYDTIRIHDTLRIKRPLPVHRIQPFAVTLIIPADTNKRLAFNHFHNARSDAANHYSANHTATFSKNDILLYETHKVKKQKDMKRISLMPVILAIQSFAGISAQEQEALKWFPVQFAFVYPLTTQWTHSTEYRYNLAVSPLYNKLGGIEGISTAGLMTQVKNDVQGIQSSGIANTARNVNGIQVAGIANVSNDVTGIQQAGIINVARSVKGVQTAGIINIADSVTKGVQAAGIVNISSGITGLSVAGVLNRTGTLRAGVQIGLINITDSIGTGVAIGLINIVKNDAYRAFSLSTADYMNVGAGFSMGHRKFFTTVYAGANFLADKLWVAGIGVSHRLELSPRWDFQPEAVAYMYLPQDFKNIRHCNSHHLKANFIWKTKESFGIVLSPSIYSIQYENDNADNYKVSPISAIFSASGNNWKNSFGVGVSVGVLFN